MKFRQITYQCLNFAMVASSALMLWKSLMLFANTESPIVVVLTGSIEPAFYRGDLLFLTNDQSDPVRAGDMPICRITTLNVPFVRRVIKIDDRGLYTTGKMWLNRSDVIGRAKGLIPYVGMVTIVMNECAEVKYVVLGALALIVIVHWKQ